MKQYLKYWPIGLVVLLLLTNPSISEFKAYKGSNTYKGLRRPINLFILSEYEAHNKYIGILGNFFELPKLQFASNSSVAVVKRDSSWKVDTVKDEQHVSATNKDPLHILSVN